MEPRQQPLTPNPQADANCLSKLCFWWTHHALRLGYQHRLEEADIYEVLPEDSSVKLSNNLGREWERESYKHKTGSKPSLSRAIFNCYGVWVLATGLAFLFEEGLRISQALFLGLIISFFEPTSTLSTFEIYMYALGWSLSYLLAIILDNVAFHKSFYLGLKMRVACTSIIYRKLLRLSHSSLHELSSSSIVNLFSSDAHRFDQSCLGINYLWIAPLETVAILVLLWQHIGLGYFAVIGIVLIVALSPLQFVLGRYLSRLRLQMSQLTDRRVRMMSEIIGGIATIKVNCWEKPFQSLIQALRRSEWMYLRAMSHCRCFNSAMYLTSGKIIMLATFVTYVFLGNTATPSAIFTTLALFDILRSSVGLLLPWGIQHLEDVLKAIERIEKFLLLEERNVLEAPTHLNILNLGRPPLPSDVTLEFEDFSASWVKNSKSVALEALNFRVKKGQMWAVVGPRNSGKTSLFMAVLGEMPRLGGFIRTSGKFGYISQVPWVYNGTVRDNILFGAAMDRRKYNKALFSCALLQDLEAFPQGDLSTIGDKGISLTIAQKAKICLARAVYQDADTYLVDDILSSMDERMSIQIFTKCFCGAMNSKTILFVTSDLNFIRAADQIVVMQAGKVEGQGIYEDLKNTGTNFKELLSDFSCPNNRENGPRDLAQEMDATLKESVTTLRQKGELSNTIRQKLGLDAYSSEESLESIIMEFKESGETVNLLDDDKECSIGGPSQFWLYFKTGGGVCGLFCFIIFSLLIQVAYVMVDWWLYEWIRVKSSPDVLKNSNMTTDGLAMVLSDPMMTFFIYLGLILFFIVMSFLRAAMFSFIAIHACKQMHRRLFASIMRAPLNFFKKHTIARVLSRFARDIGFIDDPLPATFFDCVQFFGLVIGAVVMVGVANFWMLLIIVPLGFIFAFARYYYMQTARDIKRVESSARTPIYQHLSTTLDGLYTIRAFQSEERFVRYFDRHQDRHTSAAYMYLAINRWFAIRLDFLSVLIVIPLAFISIVAKKYIDGGLLGLAMAYAINLMGLLQYAVRQSAELESQMSSVERVHRYSQLKPEADVITSTRPPLMWPQYGIVTFEGVSMMTSDEMKALKNLWCCIRAEEKVGILGKPEVSKRAFVASLLRLSEPTGVVRVDGIDICELGLHDLREKISVIPQDPVLFGGSVRRNLDPLTRYPDANIWKALAEVNLKQKIERLPGALYAEMADFSNQFSLGERQLLGLAQALLRSTKIVILEESPSILDKRIAAQIEHVIKSKFEHCTVIVIAQHVHTVIDLDRVMVLDEGRVREFDSAHYLLENMSGHFYKMVHQLPEAEITRLEQFAQQKFEDRPYCPPPQSLGGELLPSISVQGNRNFLPSFQTNRISGVLSHFTENRFSTNRF